MYKCLFRDVDGKHDFIIYIFRIEIEYITNSIGTNLYYNIELFQNLFLTFRN